MPGARRRRPHGEPHRLVEGAHGIHPGAPHAHSDKGTGKTMSVICSTLQWLLDHRQRVERSVALSGNADDDDLPDWLMQHAASTAASAAAAEGVSRWVGRSRVECGHEGERGMGATSSSTARAELARQRAKQRAAGAVLVGGVLGGGDAVALVNVLG